jgi:hypothetical protein
MLKLKKREHRLLVTKFPRKMRSCFGKGREEELQRGQKAVKKNLSIPRTSHAS